MKMYANPNITINFNKLDVELSAASFESKISHYECTDTFKLVCTEELTLDEELEYKHILDAHTVDYAPDVIIEAVKGAIEFGHELLISYSMENVLLGITEAGKTEAVLDFLAPIKNAVETGSLYLVIAKIDGLMFDGLPENLAPFVTDEKLTNFKNAITKYLG
jgi:hypothetical protein